MLQELEVQTPEVCKVIATRVGEKFRVSLPSMVVREREAFHCTI